MNNGVHKRRYRSGDPKWYWRYEEDVSGDYASLEDARMGYLHRLESTRYGEILQGKPLDRRIKIVFGAEA